MLSLNLTSSAPRLGRRIDPFRIWTILAGLCLAAIVGGTSLVAGEADGGSAEGAEHPLVKALKLAESSRDSLKEVHDYTATFLKKEVVGRRMIEQTMEMKVRQHPFSVYLSYQNPHKGREVLYVDGANRGQLLVHEDGIKKIAGTLSLSPTSPDALSENRHPITRIGMSNLIDGLVEQWREESKYGETEVKYFPNAKIGQLSYMVIEVTHPQPRKQFQYHITRLFIDKTTNLPTRLEQFSWPTKPGEKPPLLQEYNYLNVRTNVGLADRDFDRRNPAYRF